MNKNHSLNIIGLDIGDSKIGVARANTIAKIPEPLKALKNDNNFIKELKLVIENQQTNLVVVGVPRNLSGEETPQSKKIRNKVDYLKTKMPEINFVFVDESLSSVRADEYIKATKSADDQDSISACYILEEYFTING